MTNLPTKRLSTLQQQMLKYVTEYKKVNDGLAPTIREIQAALNISSTSVVDYNLDALSVKGYISRGSGRARAIQLPEGGEVTALRARVAQLESAARWAIQLCGEQYPYQASEALRAALEGEGAVAG